MGVAHDGKTNLSVYVDSKLHNDVRVLAVARGLSLGGVVAEALKDWVNKMKENPMATAMADLVNMPLENLALQELTLMTRKAGVSEALVIIGGAGTSWKPLGTKDGGPQPTETAVLDMPLRGTVVTQGFKRALTDEQRAIVVGRFPGRKHVWGSLT